MSYQATVFNVMIASPSDVTVERGIVREVIHNWNALHSESRGIALQPVSWETHSAPSVGSHPQKILNKQILERCDLLIAIFWTRLGTPTEEFTSGSVEELEQHREAGKPAMLYYSTAPVRMDSVDAEEYKRLASFKEAMRQRGLYSEYEGHADFQKKLFGHIQHTTNNDEIFRNVARPSAASERAERTSFFPELSLPAQSLLLEASVDSSGTVIFSRYIGGVHLQVNGKQLITDQSRRIVSQWEAAIAELVEHGLLVPRGNKGEYFEISERGYLISDSLVR